MRRSCKYISWSAYRRRVFPCASTDATTIRHTTRAVQTSRPRGRKIEPKRHIKLLEQLETSRGRVIRGKRTVFTREPLEQLEGLRASLFPTAKVYPGPALVVADLQAACRVVAVPEREGPATLVRDGGAGAWANPRQSLNAKARDHAPQLSGVLFAQPQLPLSQLFFSLLPSHTTASDKCEVRQCDNSDNYDNFERRCHGSCRARHVCPLG